MSRVNLIASTGLIFNEDRSMVLGVSRKDDKTKFGIPGGRVEEGESMYEALVREFKEETGLNVNKAIPIYFREDGVYVTVVYLVTDYSGEISTEEEGIVKWVTFEELKHGAFSDYNTMLEEHLKFINYI